MAAPTTEFRISGLKVARQSHRYSGRTAITADVDVSEPKPPEDVDTPLSFTMEGYTGPPPSALQTRFWAPGWNSVQSLNKFQSEVAGAKTKTGLSEKGGIQSSFVNILIMSAKICPRPKGPTRLGPYRSCQRANSRRSNQMSTAGTSRITFRRTMIINPIFRDSFIFLSVRMRASQSMARWKDSGAIQPRLWVDLLEGLRAMCGRHGQKKF